MNLLLFLVSFASADDALHSHVLDLLSGIEEPATAADWSALGASAGNELLAIAKDPALTATQRGNALVALGYFPTPEAQSVLARVVRDPAADALSRRKACTGLANGFGEAAVADLGVALGDADVQVRTAAARALGSIPGDSAQAALNARLSAESNASVRTAITQALHAKE